jgi:hypothetical protein
MTKWTEPEVCSGGGSRETPFLAQRRRVEVRGQRSRVFVGKRLEASAGAGEDSLRGTESGEAAAACRCRPCRAKAIPSLPESQGLVVVG